MALALLVRVRNQVLLVVALVSLSGCLLGDGARDDCEDCFLQDDTADIGNDLRDDVLTIVDTEYQRLSTYADADGGWGACVSTWTVGGAVLGEAASKTCVVIGVAGVETGVGGVAAAVCAGADWVQADAALGAAAGWVSGYLACSAQSTFDRYLSDFRLFNIGPQEAEDDQVEEWNTPECAAQYDEYHQVCDQPRSCKSQLLSCAQAAERFLINTQCAEMRNDHLYDCPHPEDFDWEGHQNEISEAYVAQQRCQTKMCDSRCYAELEGTTYFATYLDHCPAI